MLLTHALRAVSKVVPEPPVSNPVFINSTTGAKASGTTLTINKPASVAAGDLLIAVLVANATDGWNELSGWTRLNNIITDPSTSIQYRIADGTEGTSFGFTGGGVRASGTILRFINAGIPYVGTSNSSASPTTPHVAPSLSISSDYSVQLSVFTSDTASITWTGVDGTTLVTNTNQCSYNIGLTNVNAGATAADTATPSSASSYAAFQIGIPPVAGTPLVLTSVTSATNDASSYTFSNINIGAPDANRYVVVGFSASTGTASITISSVTIAGVTATLLEKAEYSATLASRDSGIYIAAVPTGTTATIVITFSGTMSRIGLNVYRLVGITSTTPQDTTVVTGAAGTVYDLSLVGTSAGFIIAQTMVQASTSYTWSGAIEDNDAAIESALTHSSAHEITSSGGTYSITATSGNNTNNASCSVYLG